MRRWLFALLFLLWLPISAKAEEMTAQAVRIRGIPDQRMLFDGDLETAQICGENASVFLENPNGIAAIYLVFDRDYGVVTLSDPEGREVFFDTAGMLHSYLDLEECFGQAPEGVAIWFSDGEAQLNELAAFSPGTVPDWVQRWQRIPDGQTDLLLFSTHGDDEQLFFAGLLPWYGAELGRRVQVAYFTDHRNMTSSRVHEMLNGLWAVGIRDYPVFGSFADYYTFDLADAYRFYEDRGQPEETLLAFVVEQLRRCRPLVAVGHDIAGEYGHGMHQLYTDLLRKAVEISSDPEKFPELAEEYGIWDVPKTYLHLYTENAIIMDWDIPMESFDGKTAYEVTRDLGFPAHVSQQKDFAWYFQGADTAAAVEKYSPCRYGLYRSTVGMDREKNDFFENLNPPEELPTKSPDPDGETMPNTSPEQGAQLSAAQKNWILIPAVGTMILTVFTACLPTFHGEEKT